jgi:hypothetical protein
MGKTGNEPQIISDAALDQVAGGGASPDSADLDTLAELDSANQLMLQAKMDAATKAAQSISTLLKKTSDTNSGIIGNMK